MNPSPEDVRYVNDEAIAHALQEELSKVPPGTEECPDDSSKAAVLNQNWEDGKTSYSSDRWGESEGQYYGQPGYYGQGGLTGDFQSLVGEDEDTMGHSIHGSGSRGKGATRMRDYDSYQGGEDEENLKRALALSTSEEQHELDREVAKRLTQLDPIPHVPRENVDDLPTYDAASLDHARLLERLGVYGLSEKRIQGDGNCQFRALSDQLYQTPVHHEFVRTTIVAQLKSHADVYEGYVTMPYNEYLEKMSRVGEWGDHVTLQATADSYGVKICLITSFKDSCFIEILPDRLQSTRVIYLSFWAEVHYNSIYPKGDSPGGTVW